LPELPEVETVRRDLHAAFTGRRIDLVTVEGTRTLRRHLDPGGVPVRLRGQRLLGADRRGKYLLLDLDGGDVVVIHLGMSGQLLTAAPDAPAARHTHLVVRWDEGPDLRFVDPRTFGEVFVTERGEDGLVPELAHLGFDPVSDAIGWRELGRRLAARGTKIKPLLMDQGFIAGIGNIYSDEILWTAKVRHNRPANELAPREVRAIDRATVAILGDAIEARGSSLSDEQYRDLMGQAGSYQEHHRVYGREGSPCERCGRPIVRLKAYGRSTWYCPHCQV
jgi:formamidopyrimidine-DNA glycosylase